MTEKMKRDIGPKERLLQSLAKDQIAMLHKLVSCKYEFIIIKNKLKLFFIVTYFKPTESTQNLGFQNQVKQIEPLGSYFRKPYDPGDDYKIKPEQREEHKVAKTNSINQNIPNNLYDYVVVKNNMKKGNYDRAWHFC